MMTVLSGLAVLSVFLLLPLMPQVEGDYVVSVLTRGFSNPDNMCQSCGGTVPSCCDPMNGGQCALCEGISFQYCWRLSPDTDCIGGFYVSTYSTSVVDFSLSELLGLPNPLLLPSTSGASGRWQGGMLNIDVFDYDDGVFAGLIDSHRIQIPASTVPRIPVNATIMGINDITTIELTYQVMCNDGFMGNSCNMRDLCFDVDCNNGGTCVGGDCVCNGGYMGDRCDLVDYCFNVDCNHGNCDDEKISAVCHCDPGYTGAMCDIDICTLSDCGPMGTCVVQDPGYGCRCSPGFIGEQCEIGDFCIGVVCGSGNCTTRPDSFLCVCPPGVTGGQCESTDPCYQLDCGDGMCVSIDNSTSCRCNSGSRGDACELSDHCQTGGNCSHGVCVNQVSSFACACDPGYTGTVCDVAVVTMCNHVNCSGQGQCKDKVTSYLCTCERGYSGTNCEDSLVQLKIKWVGIGVGVFVGAVIVLILIATVLIVLIRRHPKEAATEGCTSRDEIHVNRNVAYPTSKMAAVRARDEIHVNKNVAYPSSKMAAVLLREPGRQGADAGTGNGEEPEYYEVVVDDGINRVIIISDPDHEYETLF